jgi:hypothetical protein
MSGKNLEILLKVLKGEFSIRTAIHIGSTRFGDINIPYEFIQEVCAVSNVLPVIEEGDYRLEICKNGVLLILPVLMSGSLSTLVVSIKKEGLNKHLLDLHELLSPNAPEDHTLERVKEEADKYFSANRKINSKGSDGIVS